MNYSQKQIDRANEVDLVEFLRAQGEEVIKSGQEYRWKRHDSVTIRGNRYFRHSREQGGYPVDFIMEFWGKTFPEAVEMLIHERPEGSGELALPPMAARSDHVMRYLTQKRRLDPRLVQKFLDQADIYEERDHHNLVFLGKDPAHRVRYAHCRGTSGSFRQDITGSDKSYGFCWRGSGTELYVFEAPIDLLSFINLYPEDWKARNYLSLGGVASKALDRFLSDRPDIRTVFLCLDSDEAGEEACKRIASSLHPALAVNRIRPEKKDWNDVLKAGISTSPVIENMRSKEDRLQSLTMTELYDCSYPPREPVIEGLLYGGTYIFAGAPKVGKSFLMLQMAYHVATGTSLWGLPTVQAEALYLALEDDYARLQSRLFKMFDVRTTSSLHLVIKAHSIADGLMKQIGEFVQLHPKIRLIIVDTLQKVRDNDMENYSYANDYETITALKEYSDRTGICILVVHHTRKMDSSDTFAMISGTNGLLGAADGGFILQKEKRTSDKAVLSVVGRDQEDLMITLKKDPDTLEWKLDAMENKPYRAPPDPLLVSIAAFMEDKEQWIGTATELLKCIPAGDLTANVLVRKLNVLSGDLYNLFGIRYLPNKRTSERRTFLLIADREKQQLIRQNDDISSENPGV